MLFQTPAPVLKPTAGVLATVPLESVAPKRMNVHAPVGSTLSSAAETLWPFAVPPCSRAPMVAYCDPAASNSTSAETV